jgi:hypothetical protein
MDFLATLSLTSGVVFILAALFALGRNLSPLPEPRRVHSLVIHGIYGAVRHPMYGGVLLGALGLAVLSRNETRLALFVLLWWILEQKVAVEEKALSERYPGAPPDPRLQDGRRKSTGSTAVYACVNLPEDGVRSCAGHSVHGWGGRVGGEPHGALSSSPPSPFPMPCASIRLTPCASVHAPPSPFPMDP